MKRVVRISVTPVKGFRLLQPEQVVLGLEGVADNRRFFLVDENGERLRSSLTAWPVRVRAERNTGEASAAIDRVREAARGTENMLPSLREALRTRCTVGEICNVLRDEWGMYDRQRAPV